MTAAERDVREGGGSFRSLTLEQEGKTVALKEEELEQRRALVADEYNGILPMFELFYLTSIVYVAERCLSSYAEYKEALASKSRDVIFSRMQDTIAYAGGVARFFWPTKRGGRLAAKRGETLRSFFQIDSSSPISDKSLRNTLEHFDERLDEFLVENDAGGFVVQAIVGDLEDYAERTVKVFKLIDPEKRTIVILNERFEYQPIINEVGRILALTRTMELKGRLSK
jgi:hypothetical protein